MTPEEEIVALTERLPWEACTFEITSLSPYELNQTIFEEPHPTDCIGGCSGTGKVPGALHQSIERAFTAPCTYNPMTMLGKPIGMYHCPECDMMVLAGEAHPDNDGVLTSRVLRPTPGEVPCPNSVPKVVEGFEVICIGGKLSIDGQVHAPDDTCKGSGTIPGTDEASVVARLEACGRLNLVRKQLLKVPSYVTGQALLDAEDAYYTLVDALDDDDYYGTRDAILMALKTLVPEQATT